MQVKEVEKKCKAACVANVGQIVVVFVVSAFIFNLCALCCQQIGSSKLE